MQSHDPHAHPHQHRYQSRGQLGESHLHHAQPPVRCYPSRVGELGSAVGGHYHADANQWTAHQARTLRPLDRHRFGWPDEYAAPHRPIVSRQSGQGLDNQDRRSQGSLSAH